MAPAATTVDPSLPTPPSYLPDDVQDQWKKTYSAALTQAKRDYPNSTNQQRSVAMKAANALLVVPAPNSADDIDKLQEWQVLPGTRQTIDQKAGGQMRVCVTTDGQKYSFPVTVKAKKNAANGGNSTDPKQGTAV